MLETWYVIEEGKFVSVLLFSIVILKWPHNNAKNQSVYFWQKSNPSIDNFEFNVGPNGGKKEANIEFVWPSTFSTNKDFINIDIPYVKYKYIY